MFPRFEVRPGERYGFQVWDTIDGLCVSTYTVRGPAEQGAERLNRRQFEVSPPRPVEVWEDGDWMPGRLSLWSHEADGSWRGRAELADRARPGWYSADRLRPMLRKLADDETGA